MTYYRIGTTYYKLVMKPLISGDTTEVLLNWTSEAIKQDHGKEFLSTIEKFHGFCLIPSHLDYQRRIGNFYNQYSPFGHNPDGSPNKKHDTILGYLKHVFGEQLELGLDYFKILLEYPTQVLPVLCLVNKERNTGKSTFFYLLKDIFGNNVIINRNEDLRSNFNSDWAQKLVVAFEEALLDKKDDSEKIKNLATAKYYKIEAKGVDRFETEFFGKVVLTSNNEDNFIIMDNEENRYWVRKVPIIKNDAEDTAIREKMKEEIPSFLYFLITRKFSVPKKTRMWFTKEQIRTDALERVKQANRNREEADLAQILLVIYDTREEPIDEIQFTLSDAHEWLKNKINRNYDVAAVKRVIQQEWNLRSTNNAFNYTQYRIGFDGMVYSPSEKAKGRFYTIEKKRVLELNNIVDTVDDT